MNKDNLKRLVAKEAMKFIKPDMIIGVGSGSTTEFFIEELAKHKNLVDITVSSSNQTTKLLSKNGITVKDLNYTSTIDLYIDGADEVNRSKQLIKGGGGAHTKEKILATSAKKFICIVDESKLVGQLGEFPLPIEVIPMARGYVAREIVKKGGQPILREDFTTDSGNIIIDIHNFSILNPQATETELNQITGVVSNGIFSHRSADLVIIANKNHKISTLT